MYATDAKEWFVNFELLGGLGRKTELEIKVVCDYIR